eukprot:XP_011670449.1 PREDICTED: uncharacterized protein LOC105441228 [Strongylocentrotus purpuratus]
MHNIVEYSNSTRPVTADDLEHTLWHISGSDGIFGLLEDLGALHEHLEVLKHKGQREVVEGAMNILKQWRDLNSSGNQEVMLSLALETIKYTPSDKDFFRNLPEESEEKWPSTKKLKHIAKLVPQVLMKQLCDALRISYMSDDLIDEEKRFKTMSRWRDGSTKLKKEKKIKVLSTALKSIGFDGLLSPPKCKFIYRAELVDTALDLIMEDFRPFADSLGINRTKLTSYRQEFRVSQLDRGTISLVLQLCKMIESISVGDIRPKVCSILHKAGYPNVIKRFIFASEPSYGELFAIANAITKDDMPKDGADTPESGGKSNQANETVRTGHGSSTNDGEKAEESTRSDATLTSQHR